MEDWGMEVMNFGSNTVFLGEFLNLVGLQLPLSLLSFGG